MNATIERTTRNNSTFFIAELLTFGGSAAEIFADIAEPASGRDFELSLLRLRNAAEMRLHTTSPKWPNYITGSCNEM
jgi:hypothetical protein